MHVYRYTYMYTHIYIQMPQDLVSIQAQILCLKSIRGYAPTTGAVEVSRRQPSLAGFVFPACAVGDTAEAPKSQGVFKVLCRISVVALRIMSL